MFCPLIDRPDAWPRPPRSPRLHRARPCSTCRNSSAAPALRHGHPRGQAQRRGRGQLYRHRHRGAGRARAGAPAARHVYRRHRREGAASPVRRGDRQFDGRGAGGPRQLHRGGDGGRRFRDRHRQRPRHSGRPASEVQEQIRARSDHVHAARGRKVRLQGVRHLGRAARRRRVGRQCAVRAHGGRGRARADALSHGVRARQAERQAGKARPRRPTGAAPRCASSPTRRFSAPRRISSPSASSRWRAPRPTCSAASRSAGPAPRSSCAASRTCRSRPPSISPTASRTISRRRSTAPRWSIPTSSPAPPARPAATARSNGRWPGPPTPTASSPPTATPSRRRTAAPTSRACAARCCKGIKDHAERMGQGKRAAAVTGDDVMTGAACMLSVFIREPEFQGQTKDRLATAEAHPHRRERDQGPVRPLARRQSDAGDQAARLRDRARRGAHPPPPGKGNLAQERGAQAAPARQARRLHQHRGARLRAVHRRGRLGRRLGQAGARPRHAGDPAAARQDPQRRLRRPRQARAEPAARRPHPGARLRHRRCTTATRICATRRSS